MIAIRPVGGSGESRGKRDPRWTDATTRSRQNPHTL